VIFLQGSVLLAEEHSGGDIAIDMGDSALRQRQSQLLLQDETVSLDFLKA